MEPNWEEQLACANQCQRCNAQLESKDRRILSVYDHQPICLACKEIEEKKTDFEDMNRQMMASCLEKTNKPYGNPESYCFHHFCPYKCKV